MVTSGKTLGKLLISLVSRIFHKMKVIIISTSQVCYEDLKYIKYFAYYPTQICSQQAVVTRVLIVYVLYKLYIIPFIFLYYRLHTFASKRKFPK